MTAVQSELADLLAAVRDIAGDAGGPAAARALEPDGPGFDVALWRILGVDVGLAGLGLPEHLDGLGGLAEIAAVAEELGRSLLPVPFLTSTVIAGQILAAAGPAAGTALARIVAGEVAAAGVTGPDGVWDAAAVELVARGDGAGADGVCNTAAAEPAAPGDDAGVTGSEVPQRPVAAARVPPSGTADPTAGPDCRVDGVLSIVPGGVGVTLFVVAARSAEGVDLFAVDAGPCVHVVALDSLDLTRPCAMVTFTEAPATRLTTGGTAGAVVPPALDVAAVALAAEQLGGAEACLDRTVEYLRARHQFGRAVGSFQAVKHTCADLLVLVETCRSAVVRAVEAGGSAEAASVAQAWCSEAYRTVTAETVQLHGGTGFTWEHDAHLYFRRARADAALLGGATYHRERLAQLLGW